MINEKQIVEQLRNPKTCETAFSQIVREYQEPLYWQVRRMVLTHDDANDILQNTFLKAWTKIDDFRGESRLSTWLGRIAINEALNFLERNRKTNSLDEEENSLANTLESDPYFDGDETQLLLQEAIRTLPYRQRMVFNMKYFEEKKYEEMSELLDVSVGSLKASYHHAVKKITDFFNQRD